MFVIITNGSMTLSVPKGAYKTQYAPQGWVEATAEDVEELVEEPEELQEPEAKEPDLADEDPVDDEDEEVEEVDITELLEKPLSELDREELELLADYKQLDVEGITSIKELRKVIREAE